MMELELDGVSGADAGVGAAAVAGQAPAAVRVSTRVTVASSRQFVEPVRRSHRAPEAVGAQSRRKRPPGGAIMRRSLNIRLGFPPR